MRRESRPGFPGGCGAAATIGAAAVAAVMITTPAPAATSPAWLDHLKDATRAYQTVKVAKADGYGKFKDADGIACIDMPGEGGMGVHFVNGDLVGDACTALAAEGKLMGYPYEGFWLPADTLKERNQLEAAYRAGTRPWMLWEKREPDLPPLESLVTQHLQS